mgnify:CR=1 FL=1
MGRSTRSRTPANDGVRDDPASAYDMTHANEGVEQRTLACIVDNEPGVLARVVGLAFGFLLGNSLGARGFRSLHGLGSLGWSD